MLSFLTFIKFSSSERNTENTMSDLYFMHKVIFLKKIEMTMKTFVPQFFNCFSLSLNKKRGNESHEKETRHIYTSAADLLCIGIGNLNW